MRHFVIMLCAVVALAGCASELSKLTSAKEDFNAAVARVVKYESQPECSATVTTACREQKVVDVLVDDTNNCNATINGGGDSKAVSHCTAVLENDLAVNHVP